MNQCHLCGTITDWECESCGEYVCENCTMPYNQFTQIDYTLCKKCGNEQEEERANEYFNKENELKLLEKNRLLKNEKQRIYYHSEKAKEKRKIKKLEKQKQQKIDLEERNRRLSKIMYNIFKYM